MCGEVFLIAVRVELVAAGVEVFLHAEDVNALFLHLGKDVLRLEARRLAVEGSHVIGGNLDARTTRLAAVEPSCLIDCAHVGDAAKQGDARNGEPMPASAYYPADSHDDVAGNEEWQHIDQHSHCCACGWVDASAEESENGEDCYQRTDKQKHKRDILIYALLTHSRK